MLRIQIPQDAATTVSQRRMRIHKGFGYAARPARPRDQCGQVLRTTVVRILGSYPTPIPFVVKGSHLWSHPYLCLWSLAVGDLAVFVTALPVRGAISIVKTAVKMFSNTSHTLSSARQVRLLALLEVPQQRTSRSFPNKDGS